MKTLEQLKSEAREKAQTLTIRHYTAKPFGQKEKNANDEVNFYFSNKDLNTLVTTAFNAGLERAVSVAKEKRASLTCYNRLKYAGQKEALEDITTALQAEVNKDK